MGFSIEAGFETKIILFLESVNLRENVSQSQHSHLSSHISFLCFIVVFVYETEFLYMMNFYVSFYASKEEKGNLKNLRDQKKHMKARYFRCDETASTKKNREGSFSIKFQASHHFRFRFSKRREKKWHLHAAVIKTT